MMDFDFGAALRYLKGGEKLTRRDWSDDGSWIALSPGMCDFPSKNIWSDVIREHVETHGAPANFKAYIMMCDKFGEFIPYVASQSDILATDWCEA